MLGFTDSQARLCLSLALWNGQDPFLKERLFGLTNAQVCVTAVSVTVEINHLTQVCVTAISVTIELSPLAQACVTVVSVTIELSHIA